MGMCTHIATIEDTCTATVLFDTDNFLTLNTKSFSVSASMSPPNPFKEGSPTWVRRPSRVCSKMSITAIGSPLVMQ